MSPPKTDAPAPLLSTWQVVAAAGEPFAVVRVCNLQGSISVGRDAWGRANKQQPALISTEVSFSKPFGTASVDDKVTQETAHYGNLSKNLLNSLGLFASATPPKDPKVAEKAAAEGPSSADVFELLWVGLTGRVVDGSERALPLDTLPFLDTNRLKSLAMTLHLPKASLLGDGVSLTVTGCFHEVQDTNPLLSHARSLRIHNLRVPTLIGVNANERLAKQMVLADVVIDRLDVTRDIHPELEKLVVEIMEASSFETLEALGTLIAGRILSDFKIGDDPKPARERGWQVKISLAKPIAVPFADNPEVIIRAGADLP
ncbi:Dihydroneopterin aldolase-domain-containing protein [Xylariales sp. PMI_506]|nr:Dihydroneopterin aldolase-domain-containing protein [Xylariales sp. PMI_506]